jgi:hypothetical protein
MYFLGVRRLTTSSYIVYDYTASGHTDMYSMNVLYIHISIQYTYIYIRFIYLFIYNSIKM